MIEEADAIVIGAGAGLSTSAGIDYGPDHFKEKFPELVQHYEMTDMYHSSFYPFQTEEERWSYWAKHIDTLYQVPPTRTYQNLYELVKDKNYFVITTNVDGQFLKSDFDPQKVFEIQGSLSKMQCSVGCHNTLYDDLPLINEMLKQGSEVSIPSTLVPYCPVCGKTMEINLRKDAFFVEDENWNTLSENYQTFLETYHNQKILFLELGVGFNTPGIIRFPFEEMTLKFPQATLIRINDVYADVPYEIKDKTDSIKEDCSKVLEELVHS